MKCTRCSFDNPDTSIFCGQCGFPISPGVAYLEEKLEEKLRQAISEQFKDQSLVSKETSAQVLTTVNSRAQIYIGLVSGLVVLIVVILTLLGVGTYRDFSRKVTDAANAIQPQITLATSQAKNAVETASQAKNQIDSVIHELQGDIKNASNLNAQVTVLSGKISAANTQIDTRMREFQAKANTATAPVNTDELANTLFSKIKSTSFSMAGWSGNPPGSGAFEVLEHGEIQVLYMLIPDPPIYQTLQIQWGLFILPKSDIGISRNVVQLKWDKKRGDFRSNPLDLSYVPGTEEKFRFKGLSVKNDTVYGDAIPLGKYW